MTEATVRLVLTCTRLYTSGTRAARSCLAACTLTHRHTRPCVTLLVYAALAFEIPGVGEYVGELSGDGNSVAGKWSQGGMDYDLVLERKSMSAPVGEAAAQERHVRPQRPSGTPPYDVKEVVITNPDAAVALSATLTVPSEAAAGPVPAVVLVCGSGPHTRNQNVFGHDVFWVLADHLTRAGVAVVRYDKRGVGTSTGTFKGSTPVDFASDAAAVVKWLHAGAKDVFQASSVGIVGHSEGALVAAVVANALGTDVVNHVALLAGMAVPGNELVLEQGCVRAWDSRCALGDVQ